MENKVTPPKRTRTILTDRRKIKKTKKMGVTKKLQEENKTGKRVYNKKRIFLLVFILFVFCAAIICTCGYLYIDKKVALKLQNPTQSKTGVVFAAPLVIKDGMQISQDKFIEILRARSYSQKGEQPLEAGNFLLDPPLIIIKTRGFSNENGQKVSSDIFHYNTETNKLTLPNGKIKDLELEPLTISSLVSGEYRVSSYIPLSDIPKNIQNAVITTEDERFYSHSGVDIWGILRASWANLKAGRIVQGGSTLTQQLAKNTLFSPQKTLGRKVLEAFASISLERRLSKDEILERYLNEVYLGQEGVVAIHGVAEASDTFFKKQLKDITLSEAALIAGIIKAPSYYSPRRHYQRAIDRREVVLEKMYQNKMISAEELSFALQTEPVVHVKQKHVPVAPFFNIALTQELEEKIDIDSTNYKEMRVFTGLHFEMQQCAAKVIKEELEKIEQKYQSLKRQEHPLEAALVAIEPHSGLIKAWVGGRDYNKNQFDHVSQGKRQIGSTVKPFIYLTALDGTLNSYKVATVDSILSDNPTDFNLPNNQKWTPENYDKRYHGEVTLRYALENSLNIPAAYIGGRVGVKALVNTLSNFHIADVIPKVPAITLGALDTSLLELTAAYAALANGGIYVIPRIFNTVTNDGEILIEAPLTETKVADEAAVYVLTNVLQGVIQRGTGKRIRKNGFTREAAGKTGTSDNARDAWFVGYTPNLAVGVWIGFDDNKKIGLTGGSVAAPIWGEFMKCASTYLPETSFIQPKNVVMVDLDSRTLQRADRFTPKEKIVKEVFVKGTEPRSLEEAFEKKTFKQPRKRRSFSLWDLFS